MQTTSADYKTAIASTDREIRGYLKFNNSFIMRGSDGLISFKTTQQAMSAERYCFGSVTSGFCEASFFSSALDGSGVSLANSYFDAYIGVCTGNPPDADTDYIATTLSAPQDRNVVLGGVSISAMYIPLSLLSNGTEIVFTISGVDYFGTWDSSTKEASTTDGTYNYKLYISGSTAILSVEDGNGDGVTATINIGFSTRDYQVEYVCCGRYYVSEITRATKTTKIVGYDIAGRLSMDYVPTVTADPDDGYLVMDVLNDIIDQTGVNGGVHFTTFGDSTYVPQLVEGTCRDQWGWLCTIAGDNHANEYTGNRDPADLGYIGTYYAGNGVSAYSISDTTIYMDGFSAGDEFTITSLTTGTEENPIVIGNGFGINTPNPYIDNTKATAIEGTVDNYQYYPITLKWRGDPCLDIMDELSITSGGTTYSSLCMKIETTFNGGLEQTITAYADSESFYALSTSPMETKIQTVSNLVSEIAQAIETADGGVITKILDTDGTWKELVIANNQDLDQATSVWRFNINGLAHSDRYQGGTYTLAMDTQGRIVANVIQTGVLQDALGKNSWNLDTGALTITNGSINITTNSGTWDFITLKYGNASTTMKAYGVKVESDDGNEWSEQHDTNFQLYYKTGSVSYGVASLQTYNGQGALHIRNKTDGTTLVDLNAGGLFFYDTDGDERFVIDRSGDAVVSIKNGSGVTRSKQTTNTLYFYDGSSVERGKYAYNGITFSNSSGTMTATYPASSSFTAPTIYSSRIKSVSGGVCQIGSMVVVNMKFTGNYTATNSPLIATFSLLPKYVSALSCIDITSGINNAISSSVPCGVNTDGSVYIKTMTSGNIYAMTGIYSL